MATCNYLDDKDDLPAAVRTMRRQSQPPTWLSGFRKKLSNRTLSGSPVVPEVFLDESYCNNAVPEVENAAASASLAPDRKPKRKHDEEQEVDDDYHGNLNSVLFEQWFEGHCQILRD
ncbi:hypothetical protein H257_19508, partial [Aphanomyces astaci]